MRRVRGVIDTHVWVKKRACVDNHFHVEQDNVTNVAREPGLRTHRQCERLIDFNGAVSTVQCEGTTQTVTRALALGRIRSASLDRIQHGDGLGGAAKSLGISFLREYLGRPATG